MTRRTVLDVPREKPAPTEPRRRWALRIADRCDRCGAQAFARARVVVEVGGERGPVDLNFCGHHFAKHEDALRAVAVEVIDERERINARPSPSA